MAVYTSSARVLLGLSGVGRCQGPLAPLPVVKIRAQILQFLSRIHRLRSCGASGVREKRGGNVRLDMKKASGGLLLALGVYWAHFFMSDLTFPPPFSLPQTHRRNVGDEYVT